MRKVEEFDQVIDGIGKIEKETKRVLDDFQAILKRVTNPGMPAEEVIQKLLEVRNKVTSAFGPIDRIREVAIEKRIEVEKKSPPSL